MQNNLHQLATDKMTLIMWHNGFSESEKEAVEVHISRHRDSKTKKPRHQDSGTEAPRDRETKTNKPRHSDPKAFFSEGKKPRHVDSKTKKPRHLDSKTKRFTTWSSCRILTFMLTDTNQQLQFESAIAARVSRS